MEKNSRILVTGSKGMVGHSLVSLLSSEGFDNLLTPGISELNLINQKLVDDYFCENKVDYVFHLAAKVGGIYANMRQPADFLYENLMLGCNVITASKNNNVKKLLFLGSACIYPKEAKQPIKEECLQSGRLEPTNEGYALAKIAGLKLCKFFNKQYGTNFISLMPCNLYGPRDRFKSEDSHVVPSLITKFHHAKENNLSSVTIWGSGNPKREFLYVNDLSDALVFFMKNHNADQENSFTNIGSGEEISIKDLAYSIKDITNYQGKIKFDTSKPDGALRRFLDTSKSKDLGWEPKTSIKEGLKKTYNWYINSLEDHQE
ncbi:MAG: GDP-L-fucose synthase [Nanoarchaeota archaeon]|nr:GDP-L-fucose synthase [Nanoarchaeota archaeon]